MYSFDTTCFIGLLCTFIGTRVSVGEGGVGLTILPPRENNVFFLDQEKPFAITCRQNVSIKPLAINWFRGENVIERRHGSNLESRHRSSHFHEVVLHFKYLRTADDGSYTCRAEFESGFEVEKTIQVRVLNKLMWLTPETFVVQEGQSVELKCEAEGDPEPDVKFIPPDSSKFDENLYSERGETLVIRQADARSTLKEVVCRSVQTVGSMDFVNLHTIKIDVQFAPKVQRPQVTVYGIEGRNTSLLCQVDEANPKVHSMEFWSGTTRIQHGSSGEKYQIFEDSEHQRSTLMIKHLLDDDFSDPLDLRPTYSCSVTNLVGRAQVEFLVIKVQPPGQLRVELVATSPDSISFAFVDPDDAGGEGISITQYQIEYWKKQSDEDASVSSKASHDEESSSEQRFQIDVRHRHTIVLGKDTATVNPLYRISGLDLDSMYSFRISAGNVAGFGDASEFSAKTAASAASTTASQSPVLSRVGGLMSTFTSVLTILFMYFLS